MKVRVLDHPYDQYQGILGRLMMVFAGVEEVVYDFLVKTSGVEPVIASAIFSGVRMAEAIGTIKKIHEARGVELSARLRQQFQRLLDINRTRNQLAHYGVRRDRLGRDDRPPILSSARMAHVPSKLKETEMKPETVHRLVGELEAIGVSLWVHLHPEKFGQEL